MPAQTRRTQPPTVLRATTWAGPLSFSSLQTACTQAFGFSDTSEDQSSYRAEVCALGHLARSCRICADQGAKGRIFVLCDCQAALHSVERPLGCVLPLLARQIADDLSHCKALGLEKQLVWTPAHNRHQDWTSPCPLSALECRQLNDAADKKAREIAHNRGRDSERERWHRARAAAEAWSKAAIYTAAQAGERLSEHIAAARPAAPHASQEP